MMGLRVLGREEAMALNTEGYGYDYNLSGKSPRDSYKNRPSEKFREIYGFTFAWAKEKFPKRDEVTRKSEGQSYTHCRGNKKLKDAGRIEDINTWKEVPHSLKVERSCARPTSRQVVTVRDYKSELSNDHILKAYNDKSHIQQDKEDDEIEDGQLIEESDVQDVVSVTKDGNSNTKMTYSAVEASRSNCIEERSRQSKDFISNNNIVGGYDNTRILETLTKMEKRQERFKEPIAPKPIPEKIQHPQLEVTVATEEVQQQRPARKCQWAGS